MNKGYVVHEKEILRDIFVELKDIFCGKMDLLDDEIKINFDNGQVFFISVKEK